ncbi:hypothetical protein RRG08_016892 [Elysia crispata]|uniref:Amino acid transporter transmembrane domain-containing protein n=1 Tax=Elysia crispata TaxID=231223 RepID=A0AAE0ZGL3_9GAST|nr:hypothetical protein RRG08_016892 [Elysia crispata]
MDSFDKYDRIGIDSAGQRRPEVANLSGIPSLFGVCVYSFMCHHYLPSMVTPIRNKSKLLVLLLGDFVTILVFYLFLCMTAIFAVSSGSIEDLYTLNFRPNGCDPLTSVVPIQYFLVLFPVFTFLTSFPIIAITLCYNLATMISMARANSSPATSGVITRIVCPLLAVMPPILIALATNKVGVLVGVTGSYAGAGIQYVIPATLVYLARKDVVAKGGEYQHRSPFSHTGWIALVFTWTIVSIIFVTVNHAL